MTKEEMDRTQARLNEVPPSPDPANFFALKMDETNILFETRVGDKHAVVATITLRKLEDGVAYVQVTAIPQLQVALEMSAAMAVMDQLEAVLGACDAESN